MRSVPSGTRSRKGCTRSSSLIPRYKPPCSNRRCSPKCWGSSEEGSDMRALLWFIGACIGLFGFGVAGNALIGGEYDGYGWLGFVLLVIGVLICSVFEPQERRP